MSETFAELFEEFNDASRICRAQGERLPFLAPRYAALINHCAKTPEQKTQLAREFIGSGVQVLNRIASPDFKNDIVGATTLLEPYFKALSAPESVNAAPPGAAQDLAVAAYALAAKGETLDPNVFTGPDDDDAHNYFQSYRATLLELAGAALTCADDIKASAVIREEVIGNVTTANPLTPSRVLTLKPAGQPA